MTRIRRAVWCMLLFAVADVRPASAADDSLVEAIVEYAAKRAERIDWTLPPEEPGLLGGATRLALREIALHRLVTEIDTAFDDFQKQNGIVPAKPADDSEFLRRAYLDIRGVIPTVYEVRAFLADKDPQKRHKLVDKLVGSNGYVNHWTTILRQQWIPKNADNFQNSAMADSFENWLRPRLQKNEPVDRVVRKMLTAPTLFARINGEVVDGRNNNDTAVTFNQANEFKPENVAASVSRLFMGIKLECAQCHDHPFNSYTRVQFWETAAFFAEVQPVIANIPDPKLRREIRIGDTPRLVQAKFFDGAAPKFDDKTSPRETFADWLLDPKNPLFATNWVNRTWIQFFGVSFIEPVDEPGDDNLPLIPAAQKAMAKAFAESGYDHQFLLRAITRTRVYNLSSRLSDPSQGDPRRFARMNVRRMTAEQLYDSLSIATGTPVRNGRLRDGNNAFITRFASNEKPLEASTSILQALTLMNGGLVRDKTNLANDGLLGAVEDAPFLSNAARVEAMFLMALARKPTPAESSKFAGYLERGGSENDRKKAMGDIFWALLNSSEFTVNH